MASDLPADASAVSDFVRLRPRLFGIAYRMLGSTVEAEDVVQDVWLRWQTTDRTAVLDPTAFLVTMTTRAAINVAQSARARRETYIGPWLPEPIDTSADPEVGTERGQALAFAVLMLLERLSPTERAAYVLREAFDYAYREIGEILRIEEANARQLVTRARQHIADERTTPVDAACQRRLLQAFLAAAQLGDRVGLERLLASDVVSHADGNGVARAARVLVRGRERVALFVASFASHFWTDTKLTWIEANGRASVLVSRGGVVIAFATIEASADGIEDIMWIMSPEKLARISGARPVAIEE